MTYQRLNYAISLYISQITSFLSISILGIGLISIGYLLPQFNNPFIIIAITGVILFISLAFNRPELATLAFVFILYANLPAIATQVYGVSYIVAGSFFLLLVIPLVDYLWIRYEKLIIDPILILMFIFLFIALVSSFFVAKDIGIAIDWIILYVTEGIILYFLIINVVRNLNVLKHVIWILMFAGSLAGSLTLYQALTNSYDQQFGGLAQRNITHWSGESRTNEYDVFEEDEASPQETKVRMTDRAGGPLGDINRYAQNMAMLLPLVIFIFWQEHFSRIRKIVAFVGVFLIFGGMLFTYSRGAFISLIVAIGIMVFMGHIRIRTVLAGLLAILMLIIVLAPGYFGRMETILTVDQLFSEEDFYQTERVIRGRTTQMLAAWNVFLDYPILGVGPGQYSPFYSIEYMSNPDIAFREINKPRRAHILYFELAAETGLFGISVFMGMIILAMSRLLQARRRWINSRPDLAALATAVFLTLVVYLVTSIFLHLSYQRFFWFMLSLAGATLQILNSEDPKALST